MELRVGERRRHPERDDDDRRLHVVAVVRFVPCQKRNGDVEIQTEGERSQQQQRQCAFEKQIGEGEAKILEQDGQRERQARLMRDQLDEPRIFFGLRA